jgi:hypothetical protein
MQILAPYFGDMKRFRPFADAWLAQAYLHMGSATAGFISEPNYSTKPFADCIRPGQPFDVKGALVCDALTKLDPHEGLLVLDLDALLRRDPSEILRRFTSYPVAMPEDHGALVFFRSMNLEKPFESVVRHCAGVMWFGASEDRIRLSGEYRKAWHELQALPRLPWEPALPHLLEQYAWTLVHHRMNGPSLPISMNWSSRFFGTNPGAIVDHDYGHGKWNGSAAPKGT